MGGGLPSLLNPQSMVDVSSCLLDAPSSGTHRGHHLSVRFYFPCAAQTPFCGAV